MDITSDRTRLTFATGSGATFAVVLFLCSTRISGDEWLSLHVTSAADPGDTHHLDVSGNAIFSGGSHPWIAFTVTNFDLCSMLFYLLLTVWVRIRRPLHLHK